MFHCPKCRNAAHARMSRYFSDMTNERYHQCTNINCSSHQCAYINCSCTFFMVKHNRFLSFHR
ncbi:ogr/Delta-like zinc finger family protein [Lelliottia amnigena]|nr:ogr/Delta-like zinc finger family protein [Lelliottia amnigena]